MDDIYGLHASVNYTSQPSISPESLAASQADLHSILSSGGFRDRIPAFGSDPMFPGSVISDATISPEIRDNGDEISSIIKAKIASHPRYPRLLEAYIDCQKVRVKKKRGKKSREMQKREIRARIGFQFLFRSS